MRVVLVHLSDIHIRTERDPILTRVPALVAAIRAAEAVPHAYVIIVSGDLTYSGDEEQFLFAGRFLNSLQEDLQRSSGGRAQVHRVLVPGNHDCDFRGHSRVREVLIDKCLQEPAFASSPDVIEQCSAVQDHFFEFIAGSGAVRTGKDRLFYSVDLSVGAHRLRFDCFDTAWLSRLSETQGTLLFPGLDLFTVPPLDGAVIVVVMHHPYNWLEANNSRSARKVIEKYAHVVLTGHEHDAGMATVIRDTGEVSEYIEGAVLQEHGVPDVSAFNVLVADLEQSTQRLLKYEWSGDYYAPRDGRSLADTWTPFQAVRLRKGRAFEPLPTWVEYLEDPGLALTHPRARRVRLADIFVYPDLREVSSPLGIDSGPLVRGNTVADELLSRSNVLVTGADQCGKTALAKQLFQACLAKGLVPVLVKGSEFRADDGDAALRSVKESFQGQYGPAHLEQFAQLDRDRRAVIFDDLHRVRPRRRLRGDVLESLAAFAGHVFFLAHDLEEQLDEIVHGQVFAFDRFRIQGFGNFLRNELVEKWLMLGSRRQDSLEDDEFLRKANEIERTLDLILGRNFVPPFPVFILSVLQGFEIAAPINVQASTHGYYYELLIRTALTADADRTSYDFNAAYLAFLAYWMFKKQTAALAEPELREVHETYLAAYDVRREFSQMRDELVARQILARDERDDGLRFKYAYMYYYFVASYLRDHITEDDVRAEVADLSAHPHVEECANILVFLAHLSRDPFIVDQMLANADALYRDVQPATLDEDVRFLSEFGEEALRLEYVERAPADRRRELLSAKDDLSHGGAAVVDRRSDRDSDTQDARDLVDPVLRLNAALKTVEILGQILKNFPGSLKADIKERVGEACYGLGRRALAAVLEVVRRQREDLVIDLAAYLREEYPEDDPAELFDRARQTVSLLGHLVGYGLVRRVAHAVGSRELGETYKKLLAKEPTTAVKLIDVSIKLDHMGGFPTRDVKELGAQLEGNPYSLSILKRIVVQHFYMFQVPVMLRQEICAKLGIEFRRVHAPPTRALLVAPGVQAGKHVERK